MAVGRLTLTERLEPIQLLRPTQPVKITNDWFSIAGGLDRLELAGVPGAETPQVLKEVDRAVTNRGPGVRPLTGPIPNGAAPGDTLEEQIPG